MNHVPQSKRNQVLEEARRVRKGEGRLLIALVNAVLGFFAYTIRHRYDLDQLERGMGEEEAKGLWDQEVKDLPAKSRLHLTEAIPFVVDLNCLYLAAKDAT